MPIAPVRHPKHPRPLPGDLSIQVQAHDTRIAGEFSNAAGTVSLSTRIPLAALKDAAGRGAKIASVELGPPWNVGGAPVKFEVRGRDLIVTIERGVNQAAMRQLPPRLVVTLADGRHMLVAVKVDSLKVNLTGERSATVKHQLDSFEQAVGALKRDLSSQTDPAAKKRLKTQIKQQVAEKKQLEREANRLERRPGRDAQKWVAPTQYQDS